MQRRLPENKVYLLTIKQLIDALSEDLKKGRRLVQTTLLYADRWDSVDLRERAKIEASFVDDLCYIIQSLGGKVPPETQDLNALINPELPASRDWQRRHEDELNLRYRQLRLVGFPGHAKRITTLLEKKATLGDLTEAIRHTSRDASVGSEVALIKESDCGNNTQYDRSADPKHTKPGTPKGSLKSAARSVC